MGLDSSLYASKNGMEQEVIYWRNHVDLNWCMHVINLEEDPAVFDGYKDLSFVSLYSGVEIGNRELDMIEKAIESFDYKPEGRFPNSIEKDREFIACARELLEHGFTLRYDSR